MESGEEMCYMQRIIGLVLSLWVLNTYYIGVQGRITEIISGFFFLLKAIEYDCIVYRIN